MEQAVSLGLPLLAQLGIAGFIVSVIVVGALWWLKASADLRSEKEGVIARQQAQIESLRKQRDQWQRRALDCLYPGSGHVEYDDREDL